MNIIDFALSKARVFVGILAFIIVSGAATYITIPKEVHLMQTACTKKQTN